MLDRLPPELLLLILDLRNFSDPSSSSSFRDTLKGPRIDALCACTLVCKNTSSVARPELWREVSTFKSLGQFFGLYRMCCRLECESVRELVQLLELHLCGPPGLELPLDGLLLSVPNLQELRVPGNSVRIQLDTLPCTAVPSQFTFAASPYKVSCNVARATAAPASDEASRTLVSAKVQLHIEHPFQFLPKLDISFTRCVVRGDSPFLPDDDIDLPYLETIFLPANFHRLDPSTQSTSAQQARDTFLAQCEKHKVQVCYLSDEGKSEWPEWATGMRELDELVDAE